jgi:uncharacterized NAD(P)/FAD-binding protein YdhS
MTTIAIIGGGFTGAAVAYHLAKARVAADIVVYEPRRQLGAGLAYGGRDSTHRINVPATRMSLLPDDETHFARWLEKSGALSRDPLALSGGEAYPRRQDFGRYVDAQLQPLIAARRVRHVNDAVVSVTRADAGWRIVTAGGGEERRADIVVIATTHPAPSVPRELLGVAKDPRLVANALADGALLTIGREERLLIVGTGLTAADIVASVEARGHVGPIVMISRRGLRSRGHAPQPFAAEGDFTTRPARKASELLARVRRAVREAVAAGRTWHPVLDAVRINGGEIWRALSPEARRRVARHLRPYWDAHRFRAAPQIDAVLDRRLAAGSLEIRKARLGAVEVNASGFVVELKDIRRQTSTRRPFDRILLATGPAHGDVLRTQPFLSELAHHRFVTLDASGLGLKTSLEGQAIGALGAASPTLFVAGPLARGTFGELMGMPQVSNYALFIAERVRKALDDAARSIGSVSGRR